VGSQAFTGTNATAIGAFTSATLANSLALGTSSTATEIHTGATSINGGTIAGVNSSPASIGSPGAERQLQNVGPGIVSATSTDAVNGSQLYAVGSQVNTNSANITSLQTQTTTNTNNIATNTNSINSLNTTVANQGNQINTNTANIATNTSNINSLSQNTMLGFQNAYGQINNNQKEARQGIAMAAALAQAPMPSAQGKTSWKLNNAVYKNAAATSFSIAHRLPTKVPVAVTAGVAIGLQNSAIVTGGLQGEF
jgi:autotransporter adhesin